LDFSGLLLFQAVDVFVLTRGIVDASLVKNYYRIYLPISRAIFSKIWAPKNFKQRGSAYSQEFHNFFLSRVSKTKGNVMQIL